MSNGHRGHEIQISLFRAIFTEYLTALLVEQECFLAWFCVKVILSKDYTKLIYINPFYPEPSARDLLLLFD